MATTNAIDLSENPQSQSPESDTISLTTLDDIHEQLALSRQNAIQKILDDTLPRLHKTTAIAALLSRADISHMQSEHIDLLTCSISKDLDVICNQIIDLYSVNEDLR